MPRSSGYWYLSLYVPVLVGMAFVVVVGLVNGTCNKVSILDELLKIGNW